MKINGNHLLHMVYSCNMYYGDNGNGNPRSSNYPDGLKYVHIRSQKKIPEFTFVFYFCLCKIFTKMDKKSSTFTSNQNLYQKWENEKKCSDPCSTFHAKINTVADNIGYV